MAEKLTHFPSANFLSFEIDTADILAYEHAHYEENIFEEYYAIYDYLKSFLVDVNFEPFLTPDMVEKRKVSQDYYDNYKNYRLPLRASRSALDFFEHHGSFYNLRTQFIIRPENSSPSEYLHFFFLKLRQYENGLIYLKGFLEYHLFTTFKKDQNSFFEFLKLLLDQYVGFLSEQISGRVNSFMSGFKITQITEEVSNALPPGYIKISGEMTEAEVEHFFSFLYMEMSINGKPFLEKQKVQEMFKYGLAIPRENVCPDRNKLNTSLKSPKSIVTYCIYIFYSKHNPKQKKEILRFFALYLDDFSTSLETPKKFDTFMRNVTGEKPKNSKVDISKYLPDRFK